MARSTTARRRRGTVVSLLALVVLALTASVASAQESYPPPPPTDPEPEITCELRATERVRIAECVGSGLKPGSPITIEAEWGNPDEVDGVGTVGDDQTGTARAEIPCDAEGIATIRGEGEAPDDPDGEPSVTDEIERDLADFPCAEEAGTAPPSRGGTLPFTGADLMMLLLIALLLLLTGYGILRSRPRRPAA